MPAALRLDQRLVEEVGQIIDMRIGFQNDIAAPATIAAVGSAFRYKFLAAKTDAAPPAASGLGKNFDPIDEHTSLKR